MNTNQTKATAKLIKEIFDELMSLGTSQKKISTAPDSSAESYFTPPVHGDSTYFYSCSFQNQNELEQVFKQIFNNGYEHIPAAITTKLAKLAFLLKENNTEQDTELSPFIYTLY